MHPAALHSEPHLATRERAVIGGALAMLAGLAWIYTALHARETLSKGVMALCPPSSAPSDIALLLVMWFVMMAAMMLPTIGPMVEAFAVINRRRREQSRPHVATAIFVAGYLLAWLAYSVLVVLVQLVLERAGALDPLTGPSSGYVAAALFAVAGLYQLSQFKKVCLSRCYSTHNFILSEWRDGPAGAVAMGLRHGLFCVGCCAAVMLLMLAVAVMDLRWMAVLTILVLTEKLLPRPELWRHVIGAGLLLAAAGILARTLLA